MRMTLAIPVTPEEEAAFDELAGRLAARVVPQLAEALDDRPLRTIPETGEFLRCSTAKVYGLVRDKKLRTVKVGDQQRIEAAELDRYIATCRGEVDPEDGGGR